jgi:hypothetical protein
MLHTYTIRAAFSKSFWTVQVMEDDTRTVWHRSGAVVTGEHNAALDKFYDASQSAERMIVLFKKNDELSMRHPYLAGDYEHQDKLEAMGVEV